jgi:hypothetical protein
MDDDISGHDGAERFAKKLGQGRVYIVQTRGGNIEGPKDANDALRQGIVSFRYLFIFNLFVVLIYVFETGLNLRSLLEAAKPMPHEQIATFRDLRDDIHRELTNPNEAQGLPCRDLPTLTKILKGHRKGNTKAPLVHIAYASICSFSLIYILCMV